MIIMRSITVIICHDGQAEHDQYHSQLQAQLQYHHKVISSDSPAFSVFTDWATYCAVTIGLSLLI